MLAKILDRAVEITLWILLSPLLLYALIFGERDKDDPQQEDRERER